MSGPKKDMTRNFVLPIVLAILVSALLIVGTMIYMEKRRESEARYPGCWNSDDYGACTAEISRHRLMRGY